MKDKRNIRWLIIIVILVLMWMWVMIFFWIKTDEVTKDACSICAERMGEKVECRLSNGLKTLSKDYYPNGTISIDTYGDLNSLTKDA